MTATGEHTSLAARKRRAGQRLVIGIDGHTVQPELKELVREIQPAGFILFARNVVEPAQVLALNRQLAELIPGDLPPLLSVDQEGGRVQRMRAPATVWPAMRVVGATSEWVAQVATALGLELRAMGFNLDYAPVADVDSNPNNPVIGDRSFGRDPEMVGRHVAEFTRALQATGIMACAKHFPGHGDTDLDSHHDLPVVDRDLAALRRTELPPFRHAIAAKVASIMTAHVVFPAWDAEWPATLTPRIQQQVLRDELGFDGVLFTDDLEMKAVADRYPLHEQVRRTFLATVDLMLACEKPELQLGLFEEMVNQQQDDLEIERLAVASATRTAAMRQRFSNPIAPTPDLSIVGCPAHQDLAHAIQERAGRGGIA
ncbi:MAG: beta-N-acetylhexosaminidase [Myxococcota bacterium]